MLEEHFSKFSKDGRNSYLNTVLRNRSSWGLARETLWATFPKIIVLYFQRIKLWQRFFQIRKTNKHTDQGPASISLKNNSRSPTRGQIFPNSKRPLSNLSSSFRSQENYFHFPRFPLFGHIGDQNFDLLGDSPAPLENCHIHHCQANGLEHFSSNQPFSFAKVV